MEQGKSDNNYRSSVWIVMIAISGIVSTLVGLGIWKLFELLR